MQGIPGVTNRYNRQTIINECRYDLMLMCWNEDPHKRLTFTELRSKFAAMLLADNKNEYIDLHIDQNKSYYQNLIPMTMEDVPSGSSKSVSTDHDLLSDFDHSQNDRTSATHLISDNSDPPHGDKKTNDEKLARPVSLNIFLTHDPDKKEMQNPYVDLPLRMVATSLTMPTMEWGSEGAMEHKT